MKGIFIPGITVEMFRDGCLESIEELMAEGEIYDIEYDPKSAEPESHWIPCSVINQCYIPELKDVGYKGILFTYETKTGKRLVTINWIERGRLIGKKMNGMPIAYMPLPEPYRGGGAE